MEDNLFSANCPNCEHSLFAAAIFNPKFLHKADCPFCGQKTRWSRLPVTSMFSGLILMSISAAYLISKMKIDITYQFLPAIGIGLGFGFFIFGLSFLRFIALEKQEYHQKQSHIGHVHL